MAFSKGKRIEDETSTRIIDLAVNIGCKEGPDALTVTRICRELNCDRRVIYNRFRDVDEINFIVAGRCNEELIADANEKCRDISSFDEKFGSFVKNVFMYIYEKNAYFQYFTNLYQITDEGIDNGILNELYVLIEEGKKQGAVSENVRSLDAAQSMWLAISGISSMLAKNVKYKYPQALSCLEFSIQSVIKNFK